MKHDEMMREDPLDQRDTRLTANEFWRALYPKILPEAVAGITWRNALDGLRRNSQASHDAIVYLESCPPATKEATCEAARGESRLHLLADVAEYLGATEEDAMEAFLGVVRERRLRP